MLNKGATDSASVDDHKTHAAQLKSIKSHILEEGKRSTRNIFLGSALILCAVLAFTISTLVTIYTRPISVGEPPNWPGTSLLTSAATGRQLLATPSVAWNANLITEAGNVLTDDNKLSSIQFVHLSTKSGRKYGSVVTGYQLTNSTAESYDYCLFLATGYTLHITPTMKTLEPGIHMDTDLSARNRRLQLCGGVCDAIVAGVVVNAVSHFFGW